MSGVLATLLLAGWIVGLVGGIGGGLIHLLLLLAPAVAVVGVTAGVILIVADRRK